MKGRNADKTKISEVLHLCFLGTKEGLFPTIFAKTETKKKVSGYILVKEKKEMEGGGNNKKFMRLF